MYNIYKDHIVPFGIGSLTLTQTLPQPGCPSSVVDVSSTLALSWREEGGSMGAAIVTRIFSINIQLMIAVLNHQFLEG
jgi:hypothetical protein